MTHPCRPRMLPLLAALFVAGCAAQPMPIDSGYLKPYRATVQNLTRLGACSQSYQIDGDPAAAQRLGGSVRRLGVDPDIHLALVVAPALLARNLTAMGARPDSIAPLVADMKASMQNSVIRQFIHDYAGFRRDCATMLAAVTAGGPPFPPLSQQFPAEMAQLRAAVRRS